MAVTVKNRDGKDVILLNPSEKGTKVFNELQSGVHLTNDGVVKKHKNGKPKKLTDTEKAYRSGYLQAQKDSRKAYNSKQKKKSSSYDDEYSYFANLPYFD